MTAIPLAYLYLVDFESGKPVAAFSADDCRTYHQLNALEGRIRSSHGVDDPANGLALKDSAAAPLPAAVLARILQSLR